MRYISVSLSQQQSDGKSWCISLCCAVKNGSWFSTLSVRVRRHVFLRDGDPLLKGRQVVDSFMQMIRSAFILSSNEYWVDDLRPTIFLKVDLHHEKNMTKYSKRQSSLMKHQRHYLYWFYSSNRRLHPLIYIYTHDDEEDWSRITKKGTEI